MKKIILVIIFTIIIGLYYLWNNSSAVIVNGYGITNNDIDNLYQTENDLSKIIGTNVITNKTDVLYNLILTKLQKDILLQNKISLNKENNINFVESFANLSGFYKQARDKLGYRYYKLLIEPVAISKLFYKFYQAVEPSKRFGTKLLELLKSNNIDEVAKNNNIKVSYLNIPKNNNAILLQELNGKIGVYNKLIEVDDKIIIFSVIDYNEKNIQTKSFILSKMTYKEFLIKIVKLNNIEFPIYSIYNIDDIVNKKGSVLK